MSEIQKRPLVVSYGGGVNSLAMLVGYALNGFRPDAIVFSDTGGEKPETYDHMRDELRPWLTKIGFPMLTVVRRPEYVRGRTGDQTLEQECLRLGVYPSRAFGFGSCADKWKIDPFKGWAKLWEPAIDSWSLGRPVFRAIGYDAGEGRRVGKGDDKGFAKVYPLIEWGWDRERCIIRIKNVGLSVPPKSACFFCPSSTKTEVLALAQKHPDLLARALAMEAHAKQSKDESGAPRWRIDGLGRHWSWRDLVAAEDTSEFIEQPVEGCLVCADGEE